MGRAEELQSGGQSDMITATFSIAHSRRTDGSWENQRACERIQMGNSDGRLKKVEVMRGL